MQRSVPLRIFLVFCILVLPMIPVSSLQSVQSSLPAAVQPSSTGPASVLTNHNDNNRTGANLQETRLTTSNVKASSFGLLFSRPVSGHVYAQPLYVPNVTIPGQGVHNVVYVATMHNDVYAFEADNPAATAPLWHVNLGPSAPNDGTPTNDYGTGNDGTVAGRFIYTDIYVEVGIVSTPVIDPATGTMYLVALHKLNGPTPQSRYRHKLHALDITTGLEKFNGPSDAGTVTVGSASFINMTQIQRSALTLANGRVYFAFAAYADTHPYHGWIFGYNATTLQREVVYTTTPSGSGYGEGGIWMASQGLTVDGSGNIYFLTGNGNFNANQGGTDLGDSAVKLDPNLNLLDYFTPYSQDYLSLTDKDLGSGGLTLIPGTNWLAGGGKEGILYMLDRNNMGKFTSPPGPDAVLDSFQAVGGPNASPGTSHHIHGSPVFWNSPNGPRLYVWGESDYLRSFTYNITTGKFVTVPTAIGPVKLPDNNMPGGFLSLSANSSLSGTGILWASVPTSGDAAEFIVAGTLRAFDANDISKELWNSDQAAGGRDTVGFFAKFAPPTVANGKVYLGTFSDPAITPAPSSYLRVYGLLTTPGAPAYASTPDLGSTLDLGSARLATSTSSSLSFSNSGGGTLVVTNTTLTGPNANEFAVSGATFPVSLAGGSSQSINLSCTPAKGGTRSALLTVTTNDPVQPVVYYALTCTGSLIVVRQQDDGTGSLDGSLSYYLLQQRAGAGQTITFSLGSAVGISVTGQLPPVPAGVIIDGGVCLGGNPGIIIDGALPSIANDGLILGGQVVLRNVKVIHFKGRQIVTNGQGNQFSCVVARKTG